MLARRQNWAAAGVAVQALSKRVTGNVQRGLIASTRSWGTKAARMQAPAVAAGKPRGMAAGSSQLGVIRNDWTEEEIAAIYNRPLLQLIHDAGTVHRLHHDPLEVQQATLLSIKTGGCIETCGYCSQSSSWSKDTGMVAEKLLDLDEVYQAAVKAHQAGSTRFCMGAAWRGPSQVGPRQFERVLDMVSKVRALGMEVCTTLGMLTKEQAEQLKTAGLSCYNHNLDTSRSYYEKITSSRTYEDRLDTIGKVRDAGISVCTGGIIGMGESDNDRIGLLHTLSTLPEHPESVPINALVPVEGTPMAKMDIKGPTGLEMVRCVATARILMPKSMVRLSAGRMDLSIAEQAMCFLAGANSIFAGDKLLTTPNNERDEDSEMFQVLGLKPMPPFRGNPGAFEIPAVRRESIHKAEMKAELKTHAAAAQ